MSAAFFRKFRNLSERVRRSASATQKDQNATGGPARPEPQSPPAAQPRAFTRADADRLSGEFIAIPDGTVEIAPRALEGRSQLVRVSVPASVRRIGERAFAKCSELAHVEFQEGLTCIASNAFTDCPALRSMRIPDSVQQLDGRAFYHSGMAEPVLSASGEVLYYCPASQAGKAYAVPDGVRRIASHAFRDMPDLVTVRLPESLRRIDRMAFVRCGLRSITIPAAVELPSLDVFLDCDALADIDILGVDDAVRRAAIRCWLQGSSLLRPVRCALPGDEYWQKEPFASLSRVCADSDVGAMDEMVAFFEARQQAERDSGFSRFAANFWRYRACSRGSGAQRRILEELLAQTPDGWLPSACLTERLEGSAPGRALNALGFPFFDAERTYHLDGLDDDSVVEVSAYSGESGPDEDGFGNEIFYDWWYLDDSLNPLPGVDCLVSYSLGDKTRLCRERFAQRRAAAARAVQLERGRQVTNRRS